MKKVLIKLLFCMPLLTSCEDMFKPELENIYDEGYMHHQPAFAQSILGQSYACLLYTSDAADEL